MYLITEYTTLLMESLLLFASVDLNKDAGQSLIQHDLYNPSTLGLCFATYIIT